MTSWILMRVMASGLTGKSNYKVFNLEKEL